MLFKFMIGATASIALGIFFAGGALAQDVIKVGLIISMTGEQVSNSAGKSRPASIST